MRRLANGRYLFALVFVLPLITSGELCCAQFTKPTDSELQLAVIERLQAGQHDEAIALATKAAAEPNPGVDVAETLFTTAKFLFAREKYETSLALLKQIPERFPDDSRTETRISRRLAFGNRREMSFTALSRTKIFFKDL